MNVHPLIRSELGRQREREFRGAADATRRSVTPVVNAAAQGDPQAWESLVAHFSPTLRGIVRGYRLNGADTEDVLQSVWTSAFVNIDRVREPEAFGGWLAVIARREALRALERRRREVLVDEPSFAEEGDQSEPDRALVEAERADAVRAALNRLPDHQRRLLRMLVHQSVPSYADVSRRLDMPVGSIGPTRERALARLRRDRSLTAVV